MRCPLLAAACVLLFPVQSARAQGAIAGTRAIGGAITIARQTEQRGTAGTFSLPPHGHSGGATFFGGLSVTRRVELDGELSMARPVGNTQVSSHPSVRFTTTTRHRDTILSALLRFHAARFCDLVAGAGAVFASTSATQVAESYYPPFGPTVTTRTNRLPTDTRLALTAGFDVPVRAGRHLDVMPTVRLHHLSRPAFGPSDRSSVQPVAAAASVVYRAGIGLRVRF